jgi:hypothetical protein
MTEKSKKAYTSLDGSHSFKVEDVTAFVYRPDGKVTPGINPKYAVILQHRTLQVSEMVYFELRTLRDI